MRASETTLAGMIQGQKQFQVPLYQRTYSWTDEQLDLLWEDILSQAEAPEGAPAHFLGSVVLAPSPRSEASFEQWVVVDGQQRLTSLSLALAALRDVSGEVERINDLYLLNRYQRGDDRLRLLPTQADRESYWHCARGEEAGGGELAGAYRFFRRRLAELPDPAMLARIELVITTRLTLVLITADRGDNTHRIFESLNNTGLRLSQVDLLRNYLFMCLPTQAERVYTDLWLPLESSVQGARLEHLMWLHLVLDGEDRVRRQDMYVTQQDRIRRAGATEEVVESYLRELTRRAPHLLRILEPDREPDLAVREHLHRLARWPANAAHPVLMLLLDKAECGEMSTVDVADALSYVESFLARRMICQVPPNSLGRIFEDLPAQLPADLPIADGVRAVLSGDRRAWPGDEELRTAFRTRKFYQQGGKSGQQRMVLQRLEESHEHPEPVDFANTRLTIEHVLPQTPTEEWLAVLAEDAKPGQTPAQLHAELLHTLGNLTLTAVNAQLSNHPFQRKQDLLAASHLELNRTIASTDRWGAKEILARADDLADRAIRLWPGPAEPHHVERNRDWSLLHRALAALPPGAWTTYSEAAELINSHPRPVGTHLANTPDVVNAHRVLGYDGRVSATFRWAGEDRGDVLAVLRADGVRLDGDAADFEQHLSAADLAALIGHEAEHLLIDPEPADDDERRWDRFWKQLAEGNSEDEFAGVSLLTECWQELGGVFGYGTGKRVTSCFMILERGERVHVWPFTIYPVARNGGCVEVVFLHLAEREPFDDLAVREELRQRLNRVPGIDLPADKLARRPSFPLSVLADEDNVRAIGEVLRWFRDTAEA